MKRTAIAAAAAIALGAFAGAALAQAKPEVLVKQRQAAMTLQGKYFGPLGGMAQGRVPFNLEVVRRNADYLGTLSKMAWDGFDPSTANVKSRAKPEIYKQSEKFKQTAERFQADVSKLQAAAKDGNEGAIKAAIGAVGKNCGSCHDAFRED